MANFTPNTVLIWAIFSEWCGVGPVSADRVSAEWVAGNILLIVAP